MIGVIDILDASFYFHVLNVLGCCYMLFWKQWYTLFSNFYKN